MVEVTPHFYGRGVPQEPQLPIGETRPPGRKGRIIFFVTSLSRPLTGKKLDE